MVRMVMRGEGEGEVDLEHVGGLLAASGDLLGLAQHGVQHLRLVELGDELALQVVLTPTTSLTPPLSRPQMKAAP